METNFSGALWITHAAIPLLREQGGGHIVHGGVIAFSLLGVYNGPGRLHRGPDPGSRR